MKFKLINGQVLNPEELKSLEEFLGNITKASDEILTQYCRNRDFTISLTETATEVILKINKL